MLGGGHHILRASLAEKLRPLIRMEILRLEKRDEILVAEFIRRAEMVGMPLNGEGSG